MPRPRSALWRISTQIQPFLNGLNQIPTFLIIPSESGRKFRAYSGIALISIVRLKSAVLTWADQDRIYRGFLYQNRTCGGFPFQSCISHTHFPTLFVYTYARSGGSLGSVPEIGRCRHQCCCIATVADTPFFRRSYPYAVSAAFSQLPCSQLLFRSCSREGRGL